MSEEEKKFLEIVDLKKGFGRGQTRQEVLRGMNFSVAKGEFCVLLGPSGSGKSTLPQKTSRLCIPDVQSDWKSKREGKHRSGSVSVRQCA